MRETLSLKAVRSKEGRFCQAKRNISQAARTRKPQRQEGLAWAVLVRAHRRPRRSPPKRTWKAMPSAWDRNCLKTLAPPKRGAAQKTRDMTRNAAPRLGGAKLFKQFLSHADGMAFQVLLGG